MTAVTKDAKDALSNYKAGIEAATASRGARNSQFGKLKKPVGISIALLAVLGWLTWTVIPDFKAEYAKDQGNRVTANQQTQRVQVDQQDDLGRKFTLMATDVPSKPIMLPNNRCLRWSDGTPDDNLIITEVRAVNHGEWLKWEDFKKLKAEKKAPFQLPGWIRFASKAGPVEVSYWFYELRSVNCD